MHGLDPLFFLLLEELTRDVGSEVDNMRMHGSERVRVSPQNHELASV